MPASINSKDLKQYLNGVKTLLPLHAEQEKKFMSDLETSIRDYVKNNPSSTIEDVQSEYGTPTEVIGRYYKTVDAKRIVKRVNLVKWIRIVLVIILILAFAFSVFRGILLYKDYKAAQKQIVVIEETVIEEE